MNRFRSFPFHLIHLHDANTVLFFRRRMEIFEHLFCNSQKRVLLNYIRLVDGATQDSLQNGEFEPLNHYKRIDREYLIQVITLSLNSTE